MHLRVGARTDIGRVRRMNEDVYRVHATQGVFIVCDGMGGCPSGELASEMAGDTIVQSLTIDANARTFPGHAQAGYSPRTRLLADAVRRSNTCIYDRARQDTRHSGMGTTVVGAWIADHVASIAHVGDSRAYLWECDRLIPLTCDHAMGDVFDGDENVLVRALGREPDVDVDLREVPVRPGNSLVLCSDGLTRMVSETALARAIRELRDPQRVCDYLVDVANQNGGTDNITIVMVEVTENWWRRLSSAWTPDPGGVDDAQAHPAV